MRTVKGFSVHVAPYVAAIGLLWCGIPCWAALGGDVKSVQDDAAHLKVEIKASDAAGYAVHELNPPGGLIREFVSPEGKVFAVSWKGRFMPELQMLLGSYFEKYSDESKAQHTAGVRRRPVRIHSSDLVVENAGHVRAYFGRAYVPQLVPAGVNLDDIR